MENVELLWDKLYDLRKSNASKEEMDEVRSVLLRTDSNFASNLLKFASLAKRLLKEEHIFGVVPKKSESIVRKRVVVEQPPQEYDEDMPIYKSYMAHGNTVWVGISFREFKVRYRRRPFREHVHLTLQGYFNQGDKP